MQGGEKMLSWMKVQSVCDRGTYFLMAHQGGTSSETSGLSILVVSGKVTLCSRVLCRN